MLPQTTKDTVTTEMARAERMLGSLAGELISTITVNSTDPGEAPFLASTVSKLSPIIGNVIESRIIDLLQHGAEQGFRWIRQDPDFPDTLLLDSSGTPPDCAYEVKAWYALSTEITGRFRESYHLLNARRFRLVVISWMLDRVIYGTPKILDVLVVDATSVALYRDRHYNRPPEYLVIEPEDTSSRTSNLQQTNVNGYRLQTVSGNQLAEARRMISRHPGSGMPSHSPEAQELNRDLRRHFPYRLDTNFAKIDRINHPDIERFKAAILCRKERDRTVAEWRRILRDLQNTNTKDTALRIFERDVYGSVC